ncbi:MAG TPA: DUF1697 domain-containing protein [Candidatus Saccharimonadales bacterium]|nr:DUF1697 domain-containing protein [Candidatus Saccharimonadales bacterium]
MRYVALLRGINVGGKTRVEMPRLKQVFEGVGCVDVSTYINSGNVIFTDERNSKNLAEILEVAIEKEFGLSVPVIVRDQHNIAMLANKIPASWTNDKSQKTDVMFLWDNVDDESVLGKIRIDPKLERVLYLPGALVWNIGRENVARGSGIKLIKSEVYKYVTVRNINTLRKLETLL